MAQTVQLICPECQTETTRQIETAINGRLRPELKKALLEGSLLNFVCENCGTKRQIETQLLYHDPVQKLLIHVAPNFEMNRESIIDSLNQMKIKQPISLEDYHLRIVTSGAALVEKIQIFDHGFDDQAIEVVKLLTDGLFIKQEPDKPIIARYFYLQDKEPRFLYITDKEQLIVDYHPSLLEFVQDKFGKELKNQYLGEFILVNNQWATNIAQHLPGPAEAEDAANSKE